MTLGTKTDALYYARMAASLGDKQKIFPYVMPGSVVDVGTGGGELALALLNQGNDVLGLDANPVSVSGLTIADGFADETHQHVHNVDNIVACSVLHEVFSYGNRQGKVGKIDSLSNALVSFRKSLRLGGRLVVRDGVRPGRGTGILKMIATDGDEQVQKFLNHSPFAANLHKSNTDREIALINTKSGEWVGSKSSIMEFAFTITWGETSFEREVQEFYGIFTLEEYARFVEQFGFRLLHAEEYIQTGYINHLTPVLRMEKMSFPSTNALWVYEAV